jgi:hypothetical protein
MEKKSIFIKLIIFILILFQLECALQKLDLMQLKSFNQIDLVKIIDNNPDFSCKYGKLFSDDDRTPAYYFFNRIWRVHIIFEYDPKRNIYVNTLFESGGYSGDEGQFIDCNFDGIKDLVLKSRSGGSNHAEVQMIYVRKNNVFELANKNVSYPIFDYRQGVVFSRYIGRNDDFVTITKYRWVKDTLVLIDNSSIKININEYFLKFGNVENNGLNK